MVAPEYCSSGSTMPCSSPGRSTPVGLPKPQRWIQASNGFVPTLRAISTAPMFDEYLRISLVVQRLVAVVLGVVDLAVGDGEHRRDVELRVRL